MAEFIALFSSSAHLVASGEPRALGCYDDAEISSSGVALLNQVGHLVDIERNFRDQNHVGAAGNTAINRNPARGASHHLDHDHAIVRLGGRMYTVDGLGVHVYRCVESEGKVRARQIVVDRLRNTDYFYS